MAEALSLAFPARQLSCNQLPVVSNLSKVSIFHGQTTAAVDLEKDIPTKPPGEERDAHLYPKALGKCFAKQQKSESR